MLKKTLLLICAAMLMISLFGCNSVTRQFGGSQTINLEENKKFLNSTWKEDSLWILTRDMREDEKAETYTFREYSNFGMLEGTVTIVESKK